MILCADDYGISSSVSSAIRELIKQKRISATSCMMTSEVIESEIHSLKNMNADIDIGLHLVLTNDLPVISNFRLKKSNLLSKNFILTLRLHPEHYKRSKKTINTYSNCYINWF